MLITENFAILNILQALEKLSAAAKDKKTDEGRVAADKEGDDKPKNAASEGVGVEAVNRREINYGYAQNLLERHEQLANKIKNGKK